MATSRKDTTVFKELGLALTVLALWMLSLLVPLHQTSGMLRELARAGYDISDAWTVCVTLAQDESRPDQPPSICPAQLVSKAGLVGVDIVRLPGLRSIAPRLADWAIYDDVGHVVRPRQDAQPRGPPVSA